jgi:murein DD-endopeptidase MepM/ murein hydrolase activator NlpD
MSRMNWGERLRTILATAAVTSLFWYIADYRLTIDPLPSHVPVGHQAVSSGAPLQPAQPINFAASGQGSPRPASLIQFAPVAAPVLGPLVLPVQGVQLGQLVDTYTQSRATTRQHDAIDIMAPLGTPVLAAAPGRLEKLFLSKDGGNTIYIRSPDRRTMFYYAHLDHYAPGIAEGQAISAGQIIGAVGFSGNANPAAPHLHFAINVIEPTDAWSKGVAVNPYPLLMVR